MNKQELKTKIIEIIEKNGTYNGRSFSFDYYVICPDDIANAFIKNEIGDIAEWKRRAEVAEKECAEYRNSNRIVLRGLEIIKRNILRYCATDFPNILQQAEKELQEEQR